MSELIQHLKAVPNCVHYSALIHEAARELEKIEAERDALQESEKLLMMLINDAYKSATGTPSKKTTLEMMRYVANRPKLQQLVSNGDSKEIKKYRSCEKLEGEG